MAVLTLVLEKVLSIFDQASEGSDVDAKIQERISDIRNNTISASTFPSNELVNLMIGREALETRLV